MAFRLFVVALRSPFSLSSNTPNNASFHQQSNTIGFGKQFVDWHTNAHQWIIHSHLLHNHHRSQMDESYWNFNIQLSYVSYIVQAISQRWCLATVSAVLMSQSVRQRTFHCYLKHGSMSGFVSLLCFTTTQFGHMRPNKSYQILNANWVRTTFSCVSLWTLENTASGLKAALPTR